MSSDVKAEVSALLGGRALTLRAAAPAILIVILGTPTFALAQTDLVDNFDRPDGPVGNGWSNTSNNVGGDLTIRSGALTSPVAPGGEAGIYRSVNLSTPVTVSLTTTYVSGFGGIPFRYIPTIQIKSDGSLGSGYGIMPYRGDVNYSSKVLLMLNGTVLEERLASFEFQSAIDVVVTFNPDGSISGSVSAAGNAFPFTFGPRAVSLPGSNLALTLPIPDSRTAPITHATLDNFRLTSGQQQLPAAPTAPNPANGAAVATAPNRFDWADASGATSYDIAVDGVFRATVTASEWTPSLTLSAGVHNWRVAARNTAGTTTGPLWSFTIGALGTPTSPSPADNARVSAPPAVLDWADVSGAISYDVFLDGVLLGQPSVSRLALDRQLTLGPHLWRVVARGAMEQNSGPTWVFYYTSRYITATATRALYGSRPVSVERIGAPGSDIDPLMRTWIVIHGRNDSSASLEMQALAAAVAVARRGEQVLLLDWMLAARPILGSNDDFSGEDWIQPVAQAMANALRDYGFQRLSLNLIGHSWGGNVSDELAERLNGVATIVALDPARNVAPPFGGYYDAEEAGEIDFAAHSECSWAFRSSWLGSASTPTSADEAFVVDFALSELLNPLTILNLPTSHSLIRSLFGQMVQTTSTDRHFQLNRLVSAGCSLGPWTPNAFDGRGSRDSRGRYEAVVHAPDVVVGRIDFDGPMPTNFRLLGMSQNSTGNSVTLGWVMPSVGPAPSEIQIEGGFGPGQTAGAVRVPAAPEVTMNLPSGLLYLRARGVAGGVLSEPSNELPAYVAVPAIPSTPANLLGLASGSTLSLGWTNTFAGGAPAALTVDVSGAFNGSLRLEPTESFGFTGVPPGTYTFSVRAENAAGGSAPSNPVTLVFPGVCGGAPQPPGNYLAYSFGNSVHLSWDAPGGGGPTSSYELQVTGAWVGTVPVAGRSLAGSVPTGIYNISVVALNDCGRSIPTVVRSVRIP